MTWQKTDREENTGEREREELINRHSRAEHRGFWRGLGCVLGYLQSGAKLELRTQRWAQPKKRGKLLPMVRHVAPIRFRVGRKKDIKRETRERGTAKEERDIRKKEKSDHRRKKERKREEREEREKSREKERKEQEKGGFFLIFFWMRLYRALRGCSCGSRGFLEEKE